MAFYAAQGIGTHSLLYGRKCGVEFGIGYYQGISIQIKSRRNISRVIVSALKESRDDKEENPLITKRISRTVSPLWKLLLKRIAKPLSSFTLAIAELFLIASLSSIGTFIRQGQSPQWYMKNYPEDHPFLNFLTWRWILGLEFDHIYSAPYFLGLLALLAASLMACSYSRQLPIVKVARRWSFMKKPVAILNMEASETLNDAKIEDLGVLLSGSGYEVFTRGPALYAFKGLAGRFAPIGVHIAILLIMAGGLGTAIGGYHGTVMVPEGLEIRLGDELIPNSILTLPSPALNLLIHVNRFSIEQYPNGQVEQFYSDLSIIDPVEGEISRKNIRVNSPLRIGGATIYQTDWGIAALIVHLDDSQPFNLAMAPLRQGDDKLFGTAIPAGVSNSKGISILARDLESVVIYDKDGNFVGVRRPGSDRAIEVDGVNLVVDDLIGSTGLELKIDPSVPVVYSGFGALMITTLVSYLSHSQVWALQEGSTVVVGGKSNRAIADFKRELNDLLNSVPEEKETSLI